MLERVIGEAYTAGVAVDSPQMRAAASLLGAFESSVESQAAAPAPKADKVGAAPRHAMPGLSRPPSHPSLRHRRRCHLAPTTPSQAQTAMDAIFADEYTIAGMDALDDDDDGD